MIPTLAISFVSTNPVDAAMALGGVLIGNNIANEAQSAMNEIMAWVPPIAINASWLGASGIANASAITIKIGINNAAVDETEIQAIEVFPNPASDKINFKAEGLQNVTVYDMTGQKIGSYQAASDDFSMDVNGFKSGLYLFVIQLKNGKTATQSVVIR